MPIEKLEEFTAEMLNNGLQTSVDPRVARAVNQLIDRVARIERALQCLTQVEFTPIDDLDAIERLLIEANRLMHEEE